jgi:hypothetical protein
MIFAYVAAILLEENRRKKNVTQSVTVNKQGFWVNLFEKVKK